MKQILKIIITISIFSTGCSLQNVEANSEYIWTNEKISPIFKDSCIKSDNWKDKDPAEVMVEDRSLSVTKFIDTSELTSIPTALVIGFCSIGEGSGWGNELFLVGHNPKIEKQDYVIEEIFDELQGLTIDSEEIKIENDGVFIKIKGYSSESEPKCCRDAMDEVLIGFEKDLPVLKINSTNSYQLREIQNLQ
jgi:hypothetical protein